MKRFKVVFLLFVVTCVLSVNVPPVSGASDGDRIEQLIKIVGKNKITTIIRQHRQNQVTVLNANQMQDDFGPPDEKYVTAKTILEDLRKIHLSVSDLEKMLGQQAPTKASTKKESEYRQAESLFIEGKYHEALNPAKEALKQSESKYGTKSIELSNALSLLGDIELKRNKYQEAVQYLERLRTIQEAESSTNRRDITDTISRLIKAYEGSGDIARANELNEMAASRWGGEIKPQNEEQIISEEECRKYTVGDYLIEHGARDSMNADTITKIVIRRQRCADMWYNKAFQEYKEYKMRQGNR